jgi:hypothetical protein
MKQFKFFRGYYTPTLTQQWEELIQQFPSIITYPIITYPTLTGTTYTPTWIVNPNYHQYTPPNYTITTTPNYNTGYITIPYNGPTNFTATGTSLTTSNPNGITYTTGGIGGTLTSGTATFRSGTCTSKFM